MIPNTAFLIILTKYTVFVNIIDLACFKIVLERTYLIDIFMRLSFQTNLYLPTVLSMIPNPTFIIILTKYTVFVNIIDKTT